ncbi:hypothetical protein JX266_005123 [Neoarthrinium moseri]|nr:hypothetical protein JX266_005123 [Neoarthrinium moseri]
MISQQGCTSSDWDSPCHNYCEGTESDAAGLHFFWRCDGQAHCCSNNRSTTCCEDPGVHLVVLEVGKTLSHPPTTTASVASTLTAAISTSVSTTSAGGLLKTMSGASQESTATSPTGSNEPSMNDGRNLTIGLGVGIPLGIGMIAAILFLAIQIRKRRNQVAETETHAARSVQRPQNSLSYYSNGYVPQEGYRPGHIEQTPHFSGYDNGIKPVAPLPNEIAGYQYAELDAVKSRQ